ncbi:hypothetical protein PSY31_22750, partial [Shigella flexneri]|nr:hypothetical protein [Shigella flexneri]
LNPDKCVFGVKSEKFLGFMITSQGIEANLEKVQALQDMKSPNTIQQVQRLNGRIATLNCFLSRSAVRSLPFFKVLRGAREFKWREECQQAF